MVTVLSPYWLSGATIRASTRPAYVRFVQLPFHIIAPVADDTDYFTTLILYTKSNTGRLISDMSLVIMKKYTLYKCPF